MRKFLIITALVGVTLAVAGCGPDSSNSASSGPTLVTCKGEVELPVSSSASFEQEKSLEQKLFDALA